MDDFTKDLWQVIAWVVASFGGVVTATFAIVQMALNRKQRIDELRWQQTREAKQVLSVLYDSSSSIDARLMLDYRLGRKYTNSGKDYNLSIDDVLHALRIDDLDTLSDKDIYIRDCFDNFFDNLEDVWIFASVGLIRFDDVRRSLGYYVERMADHRDVYERFLKRYQFEEALSLLDEFEAWAGRG